MPSLPEAADLNDGGRDVNFTSATLAVAILLSTVVAVSAAEACTGSSPTWYAASAARDDVNACITASSSGDTITVPAGTVTWASTISVNKDVAIIGAGSDRTLISGNIRCFSINSANRVRISGFGFTDCTYRVSGNPSDSSYTRIDNNSFTSTSFKANQIEGPHSTPMRSPTVLIDNNTFRNYHTVVYGTMGMLKEGDWQHQLWSQPQPKGEGVGVVYLEDNVFEGTSGVHQNYIDGNYGGRYVSRFNTVRGHTYAEVHSVQSANRAVHWWEFYKNTIERLAGVNHVFVYYIRGGNGVSWGNRISADHSVSSHTVNNVRSCRDVGTVAGKCTGASNWDQNTSGQSGYACRDQIGRGSDMTTWAPGRAYTQPAVGAYFWDNLKGSSTQFGVSVSAGESCPGTGGDLNAWHLAQDRDWYTQRDSFDGSIGVGVGPISSRPTSCTSGVAYWATDEGEWNSRNSGPDGQLYRCTAPNTWSLYYMPYTYPHPLQGDAGDGIPPTPMIAPPSYLTTVVN